MLLLEYGDLKLVELDDDDLKLVELDDGDLKLEELAADGDLKLLCAAFSCSSFCCFFSCCCNLCTLGVVDETWHDEIGFPWYMMRLR